LADLIADRIIDGGAARVAFDGAPSAGPGPVASAVAERLRLAGRRPVVVDSAYFLRPASLRFERGRTDPDAFFDDWLDVAGLRRELLEPAGPGGSRQVVESLHDPVTDRATRAPYVTLPENAVILVHGPLLLGWGLPFDLTVHLRQSPAALARRMPEELSWTLPAYERYDESVGPAGIADVVVRCDDPARPAVVMTTG
jgi:hypothetical protein